MSLEHRRRFPFCRFCAQLGRDTLAAMTDHILPAREYPDLRRERSNFQSLCKECHDKVKQQLENYARKNKLVAELVGWCADPWSRPQQFRPAFPKPEGWDSSAYPQ